MGWNRKSRPAPIDLGTRNLDDVLEPNDYSQRSNAQTTTGNYPSPGFSAGSMRVSRWSHLATEPGRVVQEYTTISARKYIRVLGGSGAVPDWKEL